MRAVWTVLVLSQLLLVVVSAAPCSECIAAGQAWCMRDMNCYSDLTDSPCNDHSEQAAVWMLSQCPSPLRPFNASLAYRMMQYSTTAYAPSPKECLYHQGLSPEVELLGVVSQPCDMDDEACAAFVAVDRTLGAVVLAFQGTNTPVQLMLEFFSGLRSDTPWPSSGDPDALVVRYFAQAFTVLWPDVLPLVHRGLRMLPQPQVFVTGHSLGAALASLSAMELRNLSVPVTGYTFGQPRVGNSAYAKAANALPGAYFRVVHYVDPVPHLPLCHSHSGADGCGASSSEAYHHATEIWYDSPVFPMPNTTDVPPCRGAPFGEDNNCSDSAVGYGVLCALSPVSCAHFHTHYFGVWLGGFGGNNCTGPVARPDPMVLEEIASLPVHPSIY